MMRIGSGQFGFLSRDNFIIWFVSHFYTNLRGKIHTETCAVPFRVSRRSPLKCRNNLLGVFLCLRRRFSIMFPQSRTRLQR